MATLETNTPNPDRFIDLTAPKRENATDLEPRNFVNELMLNRSIIDDIVQSKQEAPEKPVARELHLTEYIAGAEILNALSREYGANLNLVLSDELKHIYEQAGEEGIVQALLAKDGFVIVARHFQPENVEARHMSAVVYDSAQTARMAIAAEVAEKKQ